MDARVDAGWVVMVGGSTERGKDVNKRKQGRTC
jgi:hypothetical protein